MTFSGFMFSEWLTSLKPLCIPYLCVYQHSWNSWIVEWCENLKLADETEDWDAHKVNNIKLCIMGACTHVGYNLLSSLLDGSVFDKHLYDIDIHLYDPYVHTYYIPYSSVYRVPTHPWKYTRIFFLLNSRPWKYLKTGHAWKSLNSPCQTVQYQQLC